VFLFNLFTALLSLFFVARELASAQRAEAGPALGAMAASPPGAAPAAALDTLAPCAAPPPQRLWAVGVATTTDKFAAPDGSYRHSYQHIYEEFLGPLHCRPLNILEIGLGCNAGPSAAGKSLAMWLHYFPRATVSVFEFDRGCVEAWRAQDPMGVGADALAKRVTFFIGDQASSADLQPALARGPYDFVLDDGGHSFRQQIVSLGALMPAVRPGGMYILEDLGTSYSNPGHPVSRPWHDWPVTGAAYVAKVVARNHMPETREPVWYVDPVDDAAFPHLSAVAARTKHVTCARETCIFRVWREGEAAAPAPEAAKGVPRHPLGS
jgi:hypothetical protein